MPPPYHGGGVCVTYGSRTYVVRLYPLVGSLKANWFWVKGADQKQFS